MANLELPELTLTLAHRLPSYRHWDLALLLFPNSSSLTKRKAAALLESDKLGDPILERLPLLMAIRDELAADIAGGASANTTAYHLNSLWAFHSWCTTEQHDFTLSTVQRSFYGYAEHLFHRARRIGNLAEESAQTMAGSIASVLTRALQLRVSLITRTPLRSRSHGKRVLGTQADKQNLTDTFAFGHLLLDLVNALTVDAVSGPLPVRIQLRCGKPIELWGRHRAQRAGELAPLTQPIANPNSGFDLHALQGSRFSLINLAIEAQLLVFVAQTTMNLTQALAIHAGTFRYQSHLNGYKVFRAYKGRRGGAVEFELHSGYRTVFEAYLAWRGALLPNADEDAPIFSFVADPRFGGGVRPRSTHIMGFRLIKKLCLHLGIPYFSPQKLRKSKVNWLLRHSGDVEFTAEIAQHSQEVLLRQYAEPHHQRAVTEISRFHAHIDPSLAMPGSGACVNPMPAPLADMPDYAPAPDCQSPAGCLFCAHQRDIEDFDHVWSLASFRYLKTLELARHRPSKRSTELLPADAVVDRVTAKLTTFKGRSDVCAMWVREALSRVEESDFHPKWDGFIQIIEAQTA